MGITKKQLEALNKGRPNKKPVSWNGINFDSIRGMEFKLGLQPGRVNTAIRHGQKLKGHYVFEI